MIDGKFIQSTSKFCLLHLVSHVWSIYKLVFPLLLPLLVAYRAHNYWYISDLIPDWIRYIWSALAPSASPLPVDLRLSTLPSLICHWWAERSQWSNEGGTAEGNNNCHRRSEWWPFSSSISSSLQQAALCCCRLTERCGENSFDVGHRGRPALCAHKENSRNHAPDIPITPWQAAGSVRI